MRTVSNLLNLEGRVFIYLASNNIRKLFLRHAEEEGFTFSDGTMPTQGRTDDIYALHHDWTINSVGWAGHMAYHNPDCVVGEPLIRVDYGKYLSGSNRFILVTKNTPPTAIVSPCNSVYPVSFLQ